MSGSIPERLQGALADRYRIVRELGRGGMATVFLADDLKHNRQVAIKVLSPELAAVVGKERFFAEIETTAQLQHPNILPLFDSGEADGLLFYAMPYVEGESLADRLARERQLPVDVALDLTRKLAAALEYAHRRGVVHRDIKPANVLLSSGEPLLADFGIALAVTQAGDGRITETGLSLGTPHYMSPEQASGDRSLDPRSDVYALGCVLYEMLLGEPPFPGPSPQVVLARILTSPPARVTASRPTVPVHVDAVVARALEKLPADRFATAADMRKALDDPSFQHVVASAGTNAGAVRAAGTSTPRGRLVVPALAGLTTIVLLLAAWAWSRPGQDAPVQRFRLDIATSPANGPEIDISADGSRVVYRGRDNQLHLRSLTSLESEPISGTNRARGPFFSPDGRSIGFNAGSPDRIYTLPLSGGTAVPVGDPADVNVAAAWSEDGFVYYQQDGRSDQGIVRAPALGGGTERILSGAGYGRPATLPGVTDRILVIAGITGAGVLEVETGVFRPISGLGGATDVRAAGPYLFYRTQEGLLAAARFDADEERLTSSGVPLAREVGEASFTVSRNGTLVYQVGLAAGQPDGLFTVAPEGARRPLSQRMSEALGDLDDVRISPDGRHLALGVYRPTTGASAEEARIFVYDGEADTWQQLTFEGQANFSPRWLPDGRVAFLSDQSGETAIWAKPFDRSAQEELLFAPPDGKDVFQFEPSPVPGGPMVVMMDADDPTHEPDLFLVDPVPGADARPFVTSRYLEVDPAVSPDGRWALYRSNETGIDQIYVRAFPQGGPPYPVVLEDAVAATWGPESRTIYYGLVAQGLVRAELDVTDGVRVTTRTPIPRTETLSLQILGATAYDVTSDGRVLAIGSDPDAAGEGTEVTPGAGLPVVILNVFREIEQRLAETEGGR